MKKYIQETSAAQNFNLKANSGPKQVAQSTMVHSTTEITPPE
jgi:hypothetical protein